MVLLFHHRKKFPLHDTPRAVRSLQSNQKYSLKNRPGEKVLQVGLSHYKSGKFKSRLTTPQIDVGDLLPQNQESQVPASCSYT